MRLLTAFGDLRDWLYWLCGYSIVTRLPA